MIKTAEDARVRRKPIARKMSGDTAIFEEIAPSQA